MQRFLEWAYRYPEPPPKVRDPKKPLQVICPGLARSGTESLQVALLKLGYDHTYHGWDILFDQPNDIQRWIRLAKKKYYGPNDGESHLTVQDFDAVLGHAVAVTDAPACVFAAELIALYPDAKVILNGRGDLDAWHASIMKNTAGAHENWMIWAISRISPTGFWSWSVFGEYLWTLFFRNPRSISHGIRRNGKWIYREHHAMVRGLVEKERLLEWKVEDGWEPLCKFLGKPVPNEPFPRVNDAGGHAGRVDHVLKECFVELRNRLGIFLGIVAFGIAAVSYQRSGRAFELATYTAMFSESSLQR